MGKKLKSDEFLKLLKALRDNGPKVKYQNPDAWRRRVSKKKR